MKTIKNRTSHFFVLVLLCVLIVSGNLFSQEESFPCKCCNSSLKEITSKDSLDNLYVFGCTSEGSQDLASSFLMPGGTPPAIPEPTEEEEIPDDSKYVAWSCKYAPGNITDKDPQTAWVEGVEGDGIGEVILVPCIVLTKSVQIWTGYGKSEALFLANSRPKKINIFIIQAEHAGAAQYGDSYKHLKVIAKETITLLDLNGYQALSIPHFEPGTYYSKIYDATRDYTYIVGIEILEVYPGTKYQDCCISEIKNL